MQTNCRLCAPCRRGRPCREPPPSSLISCTTVERWYVACRWEAPDGSFGQLGNGASGTDSEVSVGVKKLTDVRNIDGGYEFTLATTQ